MNTNKEPPVPDLDTENRHQKAEIKCDKRENVATLVSNMNVAPQADKLCYKLKDAAAILDVSYHTVWRLVERGEIRSIRRTRNHLIPRAELERWVKESVS